MKSLLFIASGLLVSITASAAGLGIDMKAPELEKKVQAYLSTTSKLKEQFKIAENNVQKCTFTHGGILKSQLIAPALKGIAEQEKAVSITHSTFKKNITKIQNEFSANGTTIIQGGSFALEKKLVGPVKLAAKDAQTEVSAQKSQLLEKDKEIQANDQKIQNAIKPSFIGGDKKACDTAKGAYSKSRELTKTLYKRLAELESAYVGQVSVAQAQVDLLTAVATK
jgi:hypothetical protein